MDIHLILKLIGATMMIGAGFDRFIPDGYGLLIPVGIVFVGVLVESAQESGVPHAE